MKKLYSILSVRFIALALIPTLAILGICSLFLMLRTSDNMEDSLDSATLYCGQLVNQLLGEVTDINALVQSDTDVQEMLRVTYETPTEIYRQRQRINGNLTMLHYNYSKFVDAFYLILDDGRCFKSNNFAFLDEDFSKTNWYKRLRLSDEVHWLAPYEESLVSHNLKSGYVGVAYPLFNVRTGLSDGILLIEIRTTPLEEILKSGLTMEHVHARIEDREANSVVSVGPEDTRQSISSWVELGNGWTLTFSCNIWRLMGSELASLIWVVGALLLVIALLAIWLGRKTARSVSKPIEALLSEMEDTQDFRARSPIEVGTNVCEIESLINHYNRMVERIQELFQELEKRQKDVRNSEFAALQAQINPHFLYNTLDNISWQIRSGNYEQALRSLMSFSRYFRLSLSKGKSLVSVHNEIRHAELYLEIQKSRYCDSFNFSVRNLLQLSDMENNYIPKLILQPLIENAIYHGVQNKAREGSVVVSIDRVEDIIVFEVADNGNGIPPETLGEINQQLSRQDYRFPEGVSNGYGIYNVNLRIKSIFGLKYGLRLESEPGKYTKSIITLPLNDNPNLDSL